MSWKNLGLLIVDEAILCTELECCSGCSFSSLRDRFGLANLSLERIILKGLNVSMQSLDAERWAANELGFLIRYWTLFDGVLRIRGGTMAGLI